MKKYLVGGAVRDSLLQLPIQERDWVVIGKTPKDMLNIGYEQVGKDFPVFLDPNTHEEYALARTEKKTGHGHADFICQTSPKITLGEDLYRRDLTINAIACDKQGNLIDLYQGQRDIKLRILRHISILFKEDPLRVLRVARFAARFYHLNFNIAEETLTLMKHMIHELQFLSPERIWSETQKALITQNPQIYFQILHKCGALKILFPEIENLFQIPGSIKKYSKISVGNHTMLALKASVLLTNDIMVRFATLCHDLGKNNTLPKQWPKQHQHEKQSTEIINNLCQRFKIPNHLCVFSKKIAKYHGLLYKSTILSPNILLQLFNTFDVWRKPEKLKQIILTTQSNIMGYTNNQYIHKHFKQIQFLQKAFLTTKSVNIQNILKSGFKKTDIKHQLHLQRQHLLYSLKKNNNNNND